MTNIRVALRRVGEVFSGSALTLGLVISAGGAFAQAHLPLTERSGTFPDGQQWQITIPANWDGTVVNDLDRIGSTSRANVILPMGYAYTGTARHPDRATNWRPRVESDNQAKVIDMVEAEFGKLRRVIQFGCSGGGSTTLSVAEDHPSRIDGAVAMHATNPTQNNNMRFDLTFALKALLDDGNVLPLIVTDATSAAGTQLWTQFLTAAQTTPQGRARMALAAILAQYPVWGSNANPPSPRPNQADPTAVQNALVRVALDGAIIAIPSRPMVDDPAGFSSWNSGIDYRDFWANADPNHKLVVQAMYSLAGLSLDADLDHINATPRLAATQEAVNHWRTTSQTGIIGVPMLHIHGLGDARIPVGVTVAYDAAVRRAGGTLRNLLYRQAFIDAPGHCTFNSAELAAAIQTMVRRIDTGKWDNLADPTQMNALGLASGLGTPRYARPGVPYGYVPYRVLNRTFFPDSPGPPQ